MDKYSSFPELAANEVLNEDYAIEFIDRSSEVFVIAPHGGWIEPGTSEITKTIAGNDLSYYVFSGLKRGRSHRDLHISSERFDEPNALELIAGTETVIGVHGMVDNETGEDVWVGGRDSSLSRAVTESLNAFGFTAILRQPGQRLSGQATSNVCNRGKRTAGIQLEISRRLRDRLCAQSVLMASFVQAVRSAIC